MEYKREELIALMREMEKQIALCHIRPRLAGAIAEELEKSVPVVRCRDCKEFNADDRVCYAFEAFVKEDDFCSYGERKDGEG